MKPLITYEDGSFLKSGCPIDGVEALKYWDNDKADWSDQAYAQMEALLELNEP